MKSSRNERTIRPPNTLTPIILPVAAIATIAVEKANTNIKRANCFQKVFWPQFFINRTIKNPSRITTRIVTKMIGI